MRKILHKFTIYISLFVVWILLFYIRLFYFIQKHTRVEDRDSKSRPWERRAKRLVNKEARINYYSREYDRIQKVDLMLEAVGITHGKARTRFLDMVRRKLKSDEYPTVK